MMQKDIITTNSSAFHRLRIYEMIKTILWRKNSEVQTDLHVKLIPELLSSNDNVIWVDIFESPYEESLLVLKDIFGFHPLAIDDALEETHVLKIDDWRNYLCLVSRMIEINQQEEMFEYPTQEVDIFVGKNYILTYHEGQSSTIDKVWNSTSKINSIY